LDSTRRPLSKYQNGFSRFDLPLSELLAKVRGGSNSDDNSDAQLLSIHASLAKSEDTEIHASLAKSEDTASSSHRKIRPGAFDLLIRPLVRCQSTVFFWALLRSSSLVSNLHCSSFFAVLSYPHPSRQPLSLHLIPWHPRPPPPFSPRALSPSPSSPAERLLRLGPAHPIDLL
jgi:hypothetical protein